MPAYESLFDRISDCDDFMMKTFLYYVGVLTEFAIDYYWKTFDFCRSHCVI